LGWDLIESHLINDKINVDVVANMTAWPFLLDVIECFIAGDFMNMSRFFHFALTGTLVWLAISPYQALAQSNMGSPPRVIFDNGNIDACELTDTAVFTIDRPVRIEQFDVWYRWRSREESVAYSLSQNGQTLRNGVLVRGDCDPYQEKWCNATDRFNLRLAPGTYAIRTERARVCQNQGSNGIGFVKVYGSRH
jgi:hypothetical protein